VEGYRVGDLWLVGFSRASKILFGDMLCSLLRWLFLVNSAYMRISFYCVEMGAFAVVL